MTMNKSSENQSAPKTDNSPENDNTESNRRDALKKMGVFATYTTPTMMTLLTSRKATAGSIIIQCLVHNSLVLSAAHNLVKVQDVRVGDTILSMDIITNKQNEAKVTKVVTNHNREAYYAINGELLITNDHPILLVGDMDQRWTRVEDLKIGDVVRSVSDSIIVKRLDYVDRSVATVYLETDTGNFVTKAGDNYYVVKSDYSPVEADSYDISMPARAAVNESRI